MKLILHVGMPKAGVHRAPARPPAAAGPAPGAGLSLSDRQAALPQPQFPGRRDRAAGDAAPLLPAALPGKARPGRARLRAMDRRHRGAGRAASAEGAPLVGREPVQLFQPGAVREASGGAPAAGRRDRGRGLSAQALRLLPVRGAADPEGGPSHQAAGAGGVPRPAGRLRDDRGPHARLQVRPGAVSRRRFDAALPADVLPRGFRRGHAPAGSERLAQRGGSVDPDGLPPPASFRQAAPVRGGFLAPL